jgi:hypothetical protein
MAFEPENDLERSLMKAAKDVAHRPQFYRDFLSSDVFILQERSAANRTPTHRTLDAGEQVGIQTWDNNGRTVIPLFSSLRRLHAFIADDSGYLAMNAKAFLEMTKGADMMLNPKADFGKEFSASEVASMLDGSIWKPNDTWVAEKETKVMIGQPANYPHDLVAALSRYFKTTPQVRRAFLAHFFNPERDSKPHTLIAIDATGDWDTVVAGAGIVANSMHIPDPPIDFMRMTGAKGIEHHFRSAVKPFYEKKRLFGIF